MHFRPIICVGFGKSGTTSLHEAFSRMPNARVPTTRKEIKYFRKKQPSLCDYLSHFADDPTEIDLTRTAIFEASPPYATGPSGKSLRDVLRKIKQTFPHAIIVLNMRQPLKRAYSHYLHNLQSFAVFGDRTYTLSPSVDYFGIIAKPFVSDFRSATLSYNNLVPKAYPSESGLPRCGV